MFWHASAVWNDYYNQANEHSYHLPYLPCVCVCERREHERSDLSKSQVYDTVLLTPVTVLYIRFQEL